MWFESPATQPSFTCALFTIQSHLFGLRPWKWLYMLTPSIGLTYRFLFSVADGPPMSSTPTIHLIPSSPVLFTSCRKKISTQFKYNIITLILLSELFRYWRHLGTLKRNCQLSGSRNAHYTLEHLRPLFMIQATKLLTCMVFPPLY